MSWYQNIRGNHIFLRLPIEDKFCAYGDDDYKCGYGTCKLDGSRRNLVECSAKCAKFKPSLSQRFKFALKILLWRGSNS